MRISRKALEKGGQRGDLTPEESRLLLAHQVTEEDFQADVERLARASGWLAYHTRRSDRSEPGFFDLVLLHPKRSKLLFAELKTQAGRSTPEQLVWAEAAVNFAAYITESLWGALMPGIDPRDRATWPIAYFLWRPFDWPEIERTLT